MLKNILKSLLRNKSAKNNVKKREPVNGYEFLTKLEDRVKNISKTTCVFINAEHPDSIYLYLQTYLHSNNGRIPQDLIVKVGGKRICLVLSTDYQTTKELLAKFKNEYKTVLGSLNYTLAEYLSSKNFKDFLVKAQTER